MLRLLLCCPLLFSVLRTLAAAAAPFFNYCAAIAAERRKRAHQHNPLARTEHLTPAGFGLPVHIEFLNHACAVAG